MRYSTASVIAFAAAAVASPLAAPQAPSTSAPAGCLPDYPGKFQIQVVNTTSSTKRSIEKRQDGKLEITLEKGILTDSQGRIGNIVANDQFQFDPAPGQAGAKYTSGWSVCQNGSLSIGNDAQFYQCLSGTFYNLYDEATAAQCYPVFINVIGGSSGAASQIPDGQVTGSAGALSDGQVTATSAASSGVATQISDGQIQASSAVAAPVTQISDGQVQATTGAPVSQISDGQVQASTAAPAYTSAAPVSQISDGQIQAPTSTASPITQISDGQIQAPTSAASPITQIGDGQIQAPTGNGTVAPSGTGVVSAPSGTGSPIAYTGAASSISAASASLLALFALALAL